MEVPGIRASTVTAILAGPLVASVVVAALVWGLAGLRASELGMATSVFLFSLFLAAPTTVLVGPFVFALMQKKNWREWFHYVLAGTVSALVLVTALTVFSTSLNPPQPAFATLFAIGAVPVGVTTALIGWLIRRPDRDARER